MTQDHIRYSQLIDQAMRGVVRDVLVRVAESGLPGEHHFYISFNTTHPGVKMSDALRRPYPKDITVVIQHQFWDLRIEEQEFHITLSFSGVPEKLTIPFAALTAFADPSVRFALQLQPAAGASPVPLAARDAGAPVSQETEEAVSAEVISLDAFRKK